MDDVTDSPAAAGRLARRFARVDWREGLAERYAALDPRELVEMVFDSSNLEPDARQVLVAEIERRSAPRALVDVARALAVAWGPEEEAALVDSYRARPCPSCGGADAKLNGVRLTRLHRRSLGLAFRSEIVAGCKDCLRRRAFEAAADSALRGLFALPFGPITALPALAVNLRAALAAGKASATPELRDHVLLRRGELLFELYGRDAAAG